MGRMSAKLKLGFSWHAVRLTSVREFAPEKNLNRIRSRNDGCRISFGILSEHHPIIIRILSDSPTRLSRFLTEASPIQER
jgi:hypothetical protein